MVLVKSAVILIVTVIFVVVISSVCWNDANSKVKSDLDKVASVAVAASFEIVRSTVEGILQAKVHIVTATWTSWKKIGFPEPSIQTELELWNSYRTASSNLITNPIFLSYFYLTEVNGKFYSRSINQRNDKWVADVTNGTERFLVDYNTTDDTLIFNQNKTDLPLPTSDFANLSSLKSGKFSWIKVYNVRNRNGNIFSGNMGLYDRSGKYIGRTGMTILTSRFNTSLMKLLQIPLLMNAKIVIYENTGNVVTSTVGNFPDPNERVHIANISDSDVKSALRELSSSGKICDDHQGEISEYFFKANKLPEVTDSLIPLEWCSLVLIPKGTVLKGANDAQKSIQTITIVLSILVFLFVGSILFLLSSIPEKNEGSSSLYVPMTSKENDLGR